MQAATSVNYDAPLQQHLHSGRLAEERRRQQRRDVPEVPHVLFGAPAQHPSLNIPC